MGGGILTTTILVLWALALLIGSVDGIYFHLWKLRLFGRPESRLEHVAHAGRAVLLVPTLWVAFFGAAPRQVPLLLTLIGADWVIAIWDVFLERKSRTSMGGMPHFEYFIHVGATAFHSGAEAVTLTALVLIGSQSSRSPAAAAILPLMLVVAAGVCLAHVVLMHPRFSVGGSASR
jgi:hypothetical protein